MITLAEPDDLPALLPLFRALQDLHALRLPEVFHQSPGDRQLETVLQQAVTDGAQVLVYATQGVPRGYLLWKPAPPGPATPMHRARRLALLDQIYVEPIWRRRGMASRLVARFEQETAALGFDGWTARVHAFNAASRALMRREGADLAVLTYTRVRAVTG